MGRKTPHSGHGREKSGLWRVLHANPTPAQNASTGSENANNNTASGSYLDEIEKAKTLHENGVISDVEFQELKSKILSRSY